MHAPFQSDFTLLKCILRYLKGTCQLEINFFNTTDSTLRVYSDSDWAGCKDTRRSTGGFCTFLGHNLIPWSSKRHHTVSHSSTETEVAQPVTPEMYCDNLSVVHLTANPALHSRSKHFEIDWHYVRERVALGALVVTHVPDTLQVADIFTKSLPQRAFFDLRFKLGLCLPPTKSLPQRIL